MRTYQISPDCSPDVRFAYVLIIKVAIFCLKISKDPWNTIFYMLMVCVIFLHPCALQCVPIVSEHFIAIIWCPSPPQNHLSQRIELDKYVFYTITVFQNIWNLKMPRNGWFLQKVEFICFCVQFVLVSRYSNMFSVQTHRANYNLFSCIHVWRGLRLYQ